jgi:exportin-2 (importin alpha re-exporter)
LEFYKEMYKVGVWQILGVKLILTWVAEFMPYIFQLFAALLEANSSATLPSYYENLIAPVIMPVMWDLRGNVPALVRLLSAIIPRGVESVMKNNQVEPILGIFQKLISTKSNEGYGFDLR